jgi:pyruvate/2-oxoglutarate dehydrogenase complex dihydrolipoamide dehydrogenase (E3) component
MKHFNDIVIGFGKGGKTLAGYLAKQGRKVALIEKDNQMYGGTCINVGCIPSKSLITSASEQLKRFSKRAQILLKQQSATQPPLTKKGALPLCCVKRITINWHKAPMQKSLMVRQPS